MNKFIYDFVWRCIEWATIYGQATFFSQYYCWNITTGLSASSPDIGFSISLWIYIAKIIGTHWRRADEFPQWNGDYDFNDISSYCIEFILSIWMNQAKSWENWSFTVYNRNSPYHSTKWYQIMFYDNFRILHSHHHFMGDLERYI